MNLSIFVAQVAAVTYLAVGVGMLLDKAFYSKLLENFYKDTAALYLGGFVALIVGFALVTFHNNWVKSWEVLVTIIGWIALIKGLLIIAFPTALMSFNKSWINSKNIGVYSFAVIVLGLVFGYFGFVA